MKRTIILFSILLCGVCAAHGQELAQAQPPEKSGTPVVRFNFVWGVQNPPRYSVTIDSAGHATYQSNPAADPNGGVAPEPYFVEWTATDATRQKIFDSVRKLNYLHGNFASHAKVAQTGSKTLTYKDPSYDNSATYNYSENPLIRELTQTFEAISTTAEMGRKLAHDVRYDKLGIDADLKALREQQRQGDAIEMVCIAPILQQIANDSSMLRIAQQVAKEILLSAGLGANLATPPTSAQE